MNFKKQVKLEIKYTFPKVNITGQINIIAFINFNFISHDFIGLTEQQEYYLNKLKIQTIKDLQKHMKNRIIAFNHNLLLSINPSYLFCVPNISHNEIRIQ